MVWHLYVLNKILQTQIRSGFLILNVVHLNVLDLNLHVLQNLNLLHEVGVGLDAELVVRLSHLQWAGVDVLRDVLSTWRTKMSLQLLQRNLPWLLEVVLSPIRLL